MRFPSFHEKLPIISLVSVLHNEPVWRLSQNGVRQHSRLESWQKFNPHWIRSQCGFSSFAEKASQNAPGQRSSPRPCNGISRNDNSPTGQGGAVVVSVEKAVRMHRHHTAVPDQRSRELAIVIARNCTSIYFELPLPM
jgi:hypothetical protein